MLGDVRREQMSGSTDAVADFSLKNRGEAFLLEFFTPPYTGVPRGGRNCGGAIFGEE